MNTETAVVETNSGKSLPVANLEDFDFDPNDVILPRILLMQGMSGMVGDGKAVMGDIVDSLSGQKIGDKNAPVAIIPLKGFKTVVTLERGTGNFVAVRPFVGGEKVVREEIYQGMRQEFVGKPVGNYETFNFYVLLAKSVEAGTVLPCLLSFRSTSAQAGKKVNSHFLMAAMNGARPHHYVLQLTCSLEKNKQGQPYYAFDIGAKEQVTDQQKKLADLWLGLLSKHGKDIKVDNERPETAAPDAGGPERF